MPRRRTSRWEEDEILWQESLETDWRIADQMLNDGELAGWEAAMILGEQEAYDDAG